MLSTTRAIRGGSLTDFERCYECERRSDHQLESSLAKKLAKKIGYDNRYDRHDDPFMGIEVDADPFVLVLDLKIGISWHRYSSLHRRM